MALVFAQPLQLVLQGAEQKELTHAFSPVLTCVCVDIVLTLLLREMGPPFTSLKD
jgi:hypothetical protein